MITLALNSVPTLFIQGFSKEDAETIIGFVRDANSLSATARKSVLFIDTPATPFLVEAVQGLKNEGYRVIYRDHHGFDGEPENVRDQQKVAAIERLEQMLGADCHITLREIHPACSSLVEVGEFENALAIIADPDADGLTAAMKAAGIYYDGLDEDAAKLDSEPSLQVTGSEISQLLAKGLATLPSYDPKRPREREKTQQRLFTKWVAAVSGDPKARQALEQGAVAYDKAVQVSKAHAKNMHVVAPEVVLVDVTETPVFDVGTLISLMEREHNCHITVLRKDKGPIAAIHGIQYSLSVCKPYKQNIDLRPLLPPGAVNDPEFGVISNVSFLLHVSEQVWRESVLPALEKRA